MRLFIRFTQQWDVWYGTRMAGCRFLDIASRLVFSHLQLAFIVTIAGSVSTSKSLSGFGMAPWPCRGKNGALNGKKKCEFIAGSGTLSQVTTAWWYLVVIKICCVINGNFRILKWRYLPYIRPMFQAYVREYPPKIWPYMVQYLHFRILKFPLMLPFQEDGVAEPPENVALSNLTSSQSGVSHLVILIPACQYGDASSTSNNSTKLWKTIHLSMIHLLRMVII